MTYAPKGGTARPSRHSGGRVASVVVHAGSAHGTTVRLGPFAKGADDVAEADAEWTERVVDAGHCAGMFGSCEQPITLHRPKSARQPLRACPSDRTKLREPLRAALEGDHDVERPFGRRPFKREPHRRGVGTRSNDWTLHQATYTRAADRGTLLFAGSFQAATRASPRLFTRLATSRVRMGTKRGLLGLAVHSGGEQRRGGRAEVRAVRLPVSCPARATLDGRVGAGAVPAAIA